MVSCVWLGLLSGCGAEGEGTITIPKEAGGKAFNPSVAPGIPTTGKTPSKKQKTEPTSEENKALPKVAKKKG
jgi:hypothetical protein